ITVPTSDSLVEAQPFTRNVSFIAPGSSPETWSSTVDYGDGSGAHALTLAANKTFGLSHQYTAKGKYTVNVIVKDSGGASNSASLDVKVNERATIHVLSGNKTRHERSTYTQHT